MRAAGFIAGRLDKRTDYPGDEKRLSGISRKIACASVALSIALIIMALSVTSGFRYAVREKATGFMGSVVLVPPGQGPFNELEPFSRNLSYIGRLTSLEGVESVSPAACRSGLVRSSNGISGLFFKGVDSLYDFSFFADALCDGALPDFSGKISSDILISSRLASSMGYRTGDYLTAYFVGEKMKVRKFRISGLFDARLEDIDNSMALVDIRHIQRISGWSQDEVSAIEIRFSPDTDLDAALQEVRSAESRYSSEGDPSLFALSIKTICSNLFDWLSLLDFNTLAIIVLMIAVAAFNMISAVLILMFRHIRTIGILKSLGMKYSGITSVFLLNSSLVLAKGILTGTAFALVLCCVQKYFKPFKLDPSNYFVDSVPVQIDPAVVAAAGLISFTAILCILSVCSLFVSGISPDKTMRSD